MQRVDYDVKAEVSTVQIGWFAEQKVRPIRLLGAKFLVANDTLISAYLNKRFAEHHVAVSLPLRR